MRAIKRLKIIQGDVLILRINKIKPVSKAHFFIIIFFLFTPF